MSEAVSRTALIDTIERVATDLEAIGVEWALVGGMAFGIRAEPRTTTDVDVALAVPTETQCEGVVRSLFDRGYQPHPEEHILEEPETGYLKAVRLVAPFQGKGVIVDILHRLCGIEDQIVGAAEPAEIVPGLVVPVATRAHLIAMKVAAWRPQDQADLRVLLKRATDSDLRRARESINAIEGSPRLASSNASESLSGRLELLIDEVLGI